MRGLVISKNSVSASQRWHLLTRPLPASGERRQAGANPQAVINRPYRSVSADAIGRMAHIVIETCGKLATTTCRSSRRMTSPHPRLLLSGDSALVVEFGDRIDPELNRRVLMLDALLAREPIAGITETVPTYRSLLVHYDPTRIGHAEISERLLELASRESEPQRQGRRWRVPVVYGGEFGIDLEAVAERAGLTTDEVVALHSGGDYRVYMLGFLPGYTYLGGLNPRLATPRREDPRLETPAGTVGIGGVQTGIQCILAPSGWNLLGRTPVRTYHPHRDPIFLMEPGDYVTFFPVPAARWEALERAAEAGDPVAEVVAA